MEDVLQKEMIDKASKGDITQYVTFNIGDEIYGVQVLKVHEIVGMTKITHVPNSMEFMKGIVNLRGKVVPVVDMRVKFRMEERKYDDQTVILIVEIKGRLIGMIVDTVSDVVSITSQNIQDTPHFSTNINTDFIDSIGNKDDQLIILLDVDRILSTDEIDDMDKKKIA